MRETASGRTAEIENLSDILVVDDEEAVCWALQRALAREGHRAAVAASAEQAFQQVQKQKPDVIVLDVRLPGMDGLSAMARLRELTQDAPIIVITAFGNLSTAVQAVANGAFEYLTKPFDLDQALDAIARALQRRSLTAAVTPESEGPVGALDEIVGKSP